MHRILFFMKKKNYESTALQPWCFIIYMLTEVHWPLFYYHLLFQFTFMLLILPYIHIAVSGFLHICFFHIRLSQSSSDLRSDSHFVFCFALHRLNSHIWFRISAFFFAIWLSFSTVSRSEVITWHSGALWWLNYYAHQSNQHHPEQRDSDKTEITQPPITGSSYTGKGTAAVLPGNQKAVRQF